MTAATPDRIHAFVAWAASQEADLELQEEVMEMATEQRDLPPMEINVFFRSGTNSTVHLKAHAWPGTEINVLSGVLQRMGQAGYTPDTGPGRSNAPSAPVQAAQPPAQAQVAQHPARACGLCGSGAVVEVQTRTKDTSPWFRCSSCDAAAWKSKEGEPQGWRASTRSG